MMQSERGDGGGGSEEMRQNQRLKPHQGDQQQPPPHPQQCPRCESLNTKFCYYNNYSLSQPRYFCKTCRRYWTQGGTLRNVPVGGGCRKGKRTKTTSGENSSSQPNQPHPPQNFTAPQTIATTNSVISAGPAVMRTKESGVPSMGSYYPGGGFLSSLAAIQSSLQQPQPFNQPVDLGGGADMGGSSSLGLLQGGFNVNVPPFGSNQQINQQRPFYQVSADRDKSTLGLIYPSDQQESLLMQSSRPAASSSSQHNWHQNFISNTEPNVSDTTMWSAVSASTGGNSSNNTTSAAGTSSTSLNSNRWPHLPGYGAPP